jgi:hypothetical protein
VSKTRAILALAIVVALGLSAIIITRKRSYGLPIVNSGGSLIGKVFHPRACVLVGGLIPRILIYDEDCKIYALDGIILDSVSPEQLATNYGAAWMVFQTNNQPHLRKEDSWF